MQVSDDRFQAESEWNCSSEMQVRIYQITWRHNLKMAAGF